MADSMDDDEPTTVSSSTRRAEALIIPITAIAANPLNPRTRFAGIEELAESLRAKGQLQAITVVSRLTFGTLHRDRLAEIGDAAYVAVLGERRLRAAPIAGLEHLTGLVLDAEQVCRPGGLRAAALAENIDREDLDPMDEAEAVAVLITELGSAKAAGAALGKTGQWASTRSGLLRLVEPLQQLVRSGEMPVRAAREIAPLPVDEQLSVWESRQSETAVSSTQFTDPRSGSETAVSPPPRPAPWVRAAGSIVRSFKRAEDFNTAARDVAVELVEHLDPAALKALRGALDELADSTS